MSQTRQRPDDQSVLPVEASRRGAHRARVGPALGALPFLAVAVVVVGVVALAWTLFGGSGSDPGAAPATVVPTSKAATTKAATTKAATTKAGGTASATKPASATTTPSAGAGGTVDTSLPVVVRNSTRTKGLAKKAADALESDGWTINGTPDNYRPAIDSTVFYADDAQQATAAAVAKDLGIGTVKRDVELASRGITVILGADWTP